MTFSLNRGSLLNQVKDICHKQCLRHAELMHAEEHFSQGTVKLAVISICGMQS